MISVIVPVYKTEAYLPQCIDSILLQTYRDLEILLIDDGSPDNCGGICEEYARSDARIKVFHTENKGLSAARNLGLREAKGEYIGFVDSDDWIEPDMYESLLRRIEETGTNISACGVRSEYRNEKNDYSMCDAVYTGNEAVKSLMRLSNGVWNKLYRKTCWTGLRFPEGHSYEEIATLYKVVLQVGSLACIPKPLYHYRMRAGSIVHTKSKKNLMDYWNAFYGRYLFLSKQPEIKEDRDYIFFLEKQIANAAFKTWLGFCRISKEQRDYAFLHQVSGFVRKQFPPFGKSEWSLLLRAGIFFCRYPNDVSFATLHLPLRIYVLIKNTIRKPFPS